MKFDDLLARFDGAVQERDGWVVRCPSHEDSHQSLRVAVGDSGAALLRCRAGCATADVLEAVGLTFGDLRDVEGVAAMPRAVSRDLPAPPSEVAALAVRLEEYADALDDEVLAYAAARFGVSAEQARGFGLGRADDMGGVRLVVPFRDPQGVARGFQARALDAGATVRWLGPPSPSGASWARLGWFPGGTDYDEVVVCEGPGDALAVAAAGFDAIGVRGAGLAANRDVVAEIARWTQGRRVVVIGDADPAGEEFAKRLVAGLTLAGGRASSVAPAASDVAAWFAATPAGFAASLQAKVSAVPDADAAAVVLEDWSPSELTDVANARRLLTFFVDHGSGVRYSPEAGFFLLDDGVWVPDRLDRVRTQAQRAADELWESVADLRELASVLTDPAQVRDVNALVGSLSSFAKHSSSRSGIDSMIREVQALPSVAVDMESFDSHHHLLAVRNGVVDLRSGDLLPHDPSLLITRRVDVDYFPDAQAPRWAQFLREIFPSHPDLPDYMRRLVGYGVTGETTEQMFAVLHGTGANGKSIFTDTLTEVFDAVTVTTPFSTFEMKRGDGVPNDLAALKGARLVHAAEGEQGKPMAEAVLKRVTGRDRIAARFMRKEFFEFRPTFLLMLATNYRPNFRGQDEGLWRRVRLIPFDRYFAPEERDYRLGETLLAEREGILAWAVRGAVEWYADGLLDPPVVLAATDEYRQTSDALMGFLPGVYVRDDSAPLAVGSKVFNDYLEWCEEENLPGHERWQRRTFFSALEERGFVKRASKSGVAFQALRRAKPGEVAAVVPLEEKPKLDVRLSAAPSLVEVLGETAD